VIKITEIEFHRTACFEPAPGAAVFCMRGSVPKIEGQAPDPKIVSFSYGT